MANNEADSDSACSANSDLTARFVILSFVAPHIFDTGEESTDARSATGPTLYKASLITLRGRAARWALDFLQSVHLSLHVQFAPQEQGLLKVEK